MKRGLAIAAVLGVVLLVAVVLAYEWLWFCPKCPSPGTGGTAYYTCTTHGVFSADAYQTDNNYGPPVRVCPSCLPDSVWCYADSAVCRGNPPHRFYKPLWTDYNH